jgi:23S rRNA pseudouridine2605 synthase
MTGPEQQSETPDNFMRLNRFLARAGVGSRRNCDKLIDSGRIAVNGQVVSELGVKVNPESDIVTFEGKRVQLPSVDVVLMLNKPAGVYTTMSDPQGRPCVAEYVPTEQYPGIYHVGRLDRDTTGLLLLTSDGQLGHQLQHPSKHVDKTYIAQVEGLLSATQIRRLRDGIDIKVGNTVKRTAPAEIDVLSWKDLQREGFDVRQSCLERNRKKTSFVRVVIHQGMKHQVKLMLGATGHPVVNLHRASFGNLHLGNLKLGSWRMLTADEIAQLRRDARI